MAIIAGIEAGGTKFICGLGDENGNVLDKITFPTTTPEETMNLVIDYFKNKKFDAIGIGSFGPINPIKDTDTYGYILKTPKPGWSNYNILGKLSENFKVPMNFNTDVNGAALAESWIGAGKGLRNVLYITVGTGIGAGAVVNGKLLQGFTHPEMGHINIKRHPQDNFLGKCPFHIDCLEGLAAGPAIEARWGEKAYNLSNKDYVWELEAYYLAQALINYILILSPEKIVMGGGVMKQKQVFPLVRKYVKELLNEYIQNDRILGDIDNYIVYPDLEDDAGIVGAIALGLDVLTPEK